MNDPIQFILQRRDEILNRYQQLHNLAEPSWKEENTSRYLRNILTEAGFSVQTFIGHHGFIAIQFVLFFSQLKK